MRKAEMKNAPNLWGWAIGAAAGLVAFGVLVVVGKFDLFPAAAIAAVVAGAAGLVLGMPWGASSVGPAPLAGPGKAGAAKGEAVHVAAAAAPAAPVAEAAAQPVAFVSAPAPAAKPAAKAKAAPKPKAEKPAAKADKPAAKAAAKPKAEKPAGPERLKAARKGKADDLKEIEGIGPAMEKLVNSLGFFHFDQIASWSDADVALVDAEMKTFKGRIARDKWVAQAKIIVAEGLEAFRERAKTNNY
jgi:predicted flap endonuclease-1-like 5' DNA nuclease